MKKTISDSKQESLMSSGLSLPERLQGNNKATRQFKEQLAADILDKFTKAQNDRSRQERQWYLNLSFYFGNQWVKFRGPAHGTNFDLHVPPAPPYRVRPVINQVRKIVRKEIARLTSQKPNAFVVPASTEDRDVFAAQAGEQIWDATWRKHKFNRILRRAVFWQTVCGDGFIKQYWDPYKEDVTNPDVMGDINIRAETPFHIFVPDLKEEELEDQPYIIHAQVKSFNWIRTNLGIEPITDKLDIVDDTLFSVLGLQKTTKRDMGIVLEVWAKPYAFPEFPTGGMFTVASNQLIQAIDGWPYEHKQYPFSKLEGVPTGKFYSTSIVEDLIPLQRELNRTRGQIIESKNKMAKPQLAAEKGSIDPRKITSEPGLVVEYKPGFAPPTPLPLQNLPTYVTEEVNRLNADLADLSGQHEVSQGQAPPGVTAAVAISFLQEQDESLISNHFDSVEEAIEKTAFQTLTYAQDYWEEERTIKVVGVDQTFDVQTFKGSDLRGNTDIRVEGGSALPTSRAAKQAFITDMMKMGFIDPQEGLEVLEIGGLNKIYERIQVDTRQAQRENLKMRVITAENMAEHTKMWEERVAQNPALGNDAATGLAIEPPLIVPVNDYDNHQVHIEIHNRYRKSQSFEMANELTKILFEEHVKQHHEAMLVGSAMQLPEGMENPLEPPGGQQQEEQQQQQPGPEEMPEMNEGEVM